VFILPTLCAQVHGAHWLDDRRYVAEPTLDGSPPRSTWGVTRRSRPSAVRVGIFWAPAAGACLW